MIKRNKIKKVILVPEIQNKSLISTKIARRKHCVPNKNKKQYTKRNNWKWSNTHKKCVGESYIEHYRTKWNAVMREFPAINQSNIP